MLTIHTCIIPHLTAGDHVLAWLRGFSGRSPGSTQLSSDASPGKVCAEPSDVPLSLSASAKPSQEPLSLWACLLALHSLFYHPALKTRAVSCGGQGEETLPLHPLCLPSPAHPPPQPPPHSPSQRNPTTP